MIQFNIHRFGKLARWSLTTDKAFYLRSFLQVFAMMTLVFLFFTTRFINVGNADGDDKTHLMCAVMLIVMLFFTIVFGPSMMFTSMKGKHNDQTLLSLPASNFEKYLMRYSTWILMLPLYLVAFFFADAIQYLVNMLIGTDHVMFVTTRIIQLLNENAHTDSEMVNSMVVTCIWTHSWYALGSTFFRSHKFAWALSTVILIVLTMIQFWLIPTGDWGIADKQTPMSTIVLTDAIYGVLTLFNFWLSYKLFCRTQVIGKFVNI